MILLQTCVCLLSCLCTLTLCQSCTAMCCSVLCCPGPAVAGSLLGAKWFLSLGKQSPSNLDPLRSIWIHFTLTRRKTGNSRASLGAGAEPAGKRAAVCQCVCTAASEWVCVGLVRTHGYLLKNRGVSAQCICFSSNAAYAACLALKMHGWILGWQKERVES